MAEQKNKSMTNAENPKELDKPLFPTEEIIRSKKFREKYQQDFMRALLPKAQYTLEDAEKIISNYFKKIISNYFNGRGR